jgi:2-keto-4-pentenoate hydratase/2-oxohepta-3-ene-1,7-dioic acid hydratase in catechol pathway
VDPWPARGIVPKLSQVDESGDYEAELAVVIGKTAKNVSESEALDYVLGYTAANDVSSRTQQLNQSQWSFSKSFDGSCPIGKVIRIYREFKLIISPKALHLPSSLLSRIPQSCSCEVLRTVKCTRRAVLSKYIRPDTRIGLLTALSDLIFSVPKIISWLSQGTTLLPGTIIITGTPAGVGMGRTPKDALRHGDEFAVEILPHIGTLTNIFENEKNGFLTKL